MARVEIDDFATTWINRLKEETESYRENILTGNVGSYENYRWQCGVLVGMEMAIEEAKRVYKEMTQELIDDKEG